MMIMRRSVGRGNDGAACNRARVVRSDWAPARGHNGHVGRRTFLRWCRRWGQVGLLVGRLPPGRDNLWPELDRNPVPPDLQRTRGADPAKPGDLSWLGGRLARATEDVDVAQRGHAPDEVHRERQRCHKISGTPILCRRWHSNLDGRWGVPVHREDCCWRFGPDSSWSPSGEDSHSALPSALCARDCLRRKRRLRRRASAASLASSPFGKRSGLVLLFRRWSKRRYRTITATPKWSAASRVVLPSNALQTISSFSGTPWTYFDPEIHGTPCFLQINAAVVGEQGTDDKLRCGSLAASSTISTSLGSFWPRCFQWARICSMCEPNSFKFSILLSHRHPFS